MHFHIIQPAFIAFIQGQGSCNELVGKGSASLSGKVTFSFSLKKKKAFTEKPLAFLITN